MSREAAVLSCAVIALKRAHGLPAGQERDYWYGLWCALSAAIDARYSEHMERRNIMRAMEVGHV